MRAAWLAMVLGLLLAACTPASVDKSGGSGPTMTLRLATSDLPGGPQAPALEHFAAAVSRLSGDRLRVRTVYNADGGTPRLDQAVARQIQDGTFDLGIVPARSWDGLGVEGLRALQAPFLLDSDELVDEVVEGELAEPMLGSLDGTGVRGLALWPETLRHPVGFGAPMLSLADFRGARLLAPYSRDVYAVLRTLGSHPVWLEPEAVNAAYAEGSLTGAESGADRSLGPPVTLTADVTLYGKIDTVVVHDRTWERLPDDAREALVEAAGNTRAWLVRTRPREGELLENACTQGKGVALAGPAVTAALRRAVAPARARMLADPEVGPTIRRIQAVKEETPVTPLFPTECESRGAAADIGTPIDPAVLDGTYRTTFAEKELLDAGTDPQSAESNAGVWTIRLDGGRYSDLESDCTARYRVSRTMISFRWDPGSRCTGDWTSQWKLTDQGVRFLRVQSTYAGDRAVWGLHEWVRLP
jgi:TRAP-type C4-dicarboxylate transport system substrate-binding protein